MHIRLSYAIFVVLALSTSAIAQNFSQDPTKPFNPTPQQFTAPSPETYGTSSEVAIPVSAFEFNPPQSLITVAYTQGKYVNNTSSGSLEAGVHLPAGASITRVEAQACNTNTALIGTLDFFRIDSSGNATLLATVSIAPNTNCMLSSVTLSTPHTVNNATNFYYLVWLNGSALDGTILIQAARVYYKLQISPDPPAPATFTDVPVGHPLHRFVEALVAAGITGGCGGGNYCPDAPVTRGQMAVFLSAALGLHWAP